MYGRGSAKVGSGRGTVRMVDCDNVNCRSKLSRCKATQLTTLGTQSLPARVVVYRTPTHLGTTSTVPLPRLALPLPYHYPQARPRLPYLSLGTTTRFTTHCPTVYNSTPAFNVSWNPDCLLSVFRTINQLVVSVAIRRRDATPSS